MENNFFQRNFFQNLLQYVKNSVDQARCLKIFKDKKNCIKTLGRLLEPLKAFDCIFDDLLFGKLNMHSC